MLAHRIRSQLGRHMIGKHQCGATVLLLVRPIRSPDKPNTTRRKVPGGRARRARRFCLRTSRPLKVTGRPHEEIRHYTKVSKGYQRSVHKGCTMKHFWRHLPIPSQYHTEKVKVPPGLTGRGWCDFSCCGLRMLCLLLLACFTSNISCNIISMYSSHMSQLCWHHRFGFYLHNYLALTR